MHIYIYTYMVHICIILYMYHVHIRIDTCWIRDTFPIACSQNCYTDKGSSWNVCITTT